MRSIRTGFILVLGILILLIDAQTVFPFIEVKPLDEKRLLASFPSVEELLRDRGRLAPAINQWFDDRMGFRPLLVRTSHQIDFSVFGYSDKVYVGYDGWLFGRDFVDEQITSDREGASLQKHLQETFEGVSRYLKKRSIKLIIVSNPVKSTVYPKYVPSDAPHREVHNQYELLRDYLKAGRDWIYLDGQDMLDQCRGHQLFYRLDVHLTVPAEFCIAVQVVNRIAQSEGRSPSFWDPKFTYKNDPPSSDGGLVSFLSVLFPPTEVYETSDQAYSAAIEPAGGSFNRPAKHFYDHFYEYDPKHPFEWIYTSSEATKNSKLPPIVWYGNSFTDYYFDAGFQFQFAEAYRIRSTGSSLNDALAALPPSTKYFMLQFTEPNLRTLADQKILN